MHTQMCAHIHRRAHIRAQRCVHAHICVLTHVRRGVRMHYIHVCSHMCTHRCTYIHIHVLTCMHTEVCAHITYTCLHMCTEVCVYMHTHVLTHAQRCVHIHICVIAHMPKEVCTLYIRVLAHVHTEVCAYTHTHAHGGPESYKEETGGRPGGLAVRRTQKGVTSADISFSKKKFKNAWEESRKEEPDVLRAPGAIGTAVFTPSPQSGVETLPPSPSAKQPSPEQSEDPHRPWGWHQDRAAPTHHSVGP